MNLSDWQERLEEHFGALRGKRTTEVGDQPVFALEHGLGEAEVAAVAEGVRAHIREAAPSWKHRLPWTVYAAELGYRYSGDEYWQTFEERTPSWLVHGDRHWVRRCFRDFQERYGGAEPTGSWARQFSIICWPITHAILPQDLQRQLAKLLYEFRHVTSSETLASSRRLGGLIANHSWRTSSRFQQLAQEPLLIGQIAAALLLQGERGAYSLILPSTLTRIGEDLDRERRVRVWMQGARDSARRQLRLAGAAVPRQEASSDDGHAEDRSREAAKLGIEPRLLLRPCAGDEHDWDVVLELPSFAHIPSRFPELRATLLGSRCRVAGSSRRPWPLRHLLHSSRRVQLRRWPSDDEGLLELERPNPELEYLLKTECSLRPGPAWLFKVATDGLAYGLRRTHVRAGQRYVLLRKVAPGVGPHPAVRPARLSCEGVYAVFLELPEAIAPDLDEILTRLGLPHAGTIRVWPAGLTPARWDGEGGVEWLHIETPCVGLQADHHVEAFVAELGRQTIEVVPADAGVPVFIELPGLPVGRHTLRVAARVPTGGLGDEPTVLEIQIREPRVWNPETGGQGGLLVIVDPHAPTLEQFWEGDVGIEVHGPRGRHVDCSLYLYEKGDTMPSLQWRLPRMRLPVPADDWRTHVERLKEERKVQNAYDLAHSAEVRFTAGELGAFTLTVEREFTPLRWALRRVKEGYFLRAIDDTGGESAVEVRFFAFGTPDKARVIDERVCCAGGGTAADGGLYVVSASGHERAILIPGKVRTFGDLRVDPRLRPRARRPEETTELIRLIDLWAGARLTGNILLRTMRRQVLEPMTKELFGLICGPRWGDAERAIAQDGAEVVREAKRAISSKAREAELAAVLVRDAADLAASAPGDRATRLAEIAKEFLGLRPMGHGREQIVSSLWRNGVPVAQRHTEGPDDPRWLSELALRLASCPAGILVWAGDHAEAGLSRLLDGPALARAARFMVLVVNHEELPAETNAGLLYDAWRWS